MIRTALLSLAILVAASSVQAETPRVAITRLSLGLPPGVQPVGRPEPFHSVVKFGAWAPLYFDLEVKEPITEPAELVIETPDGDEVKTTLSIPLPPLTEARTLTMRELPVKPYVRIANAASDTVLRIRTASGEVAEPYRIRHVAPTSAKTYVVLSLGTALPGFDLPREKSEESASYRGGRVETASISDFEDLPERWFGYEAADLVVLATGTATGEFLSRLFDDAGPPSDVAKREALLEWARRGGRVVIAAGANLPTLARSRSFRELLPYTLSSEEPARGVPGLFFRWKSAGGSPQSANLVPSAGAMPVANLAPKPDRPARVLLEDRPSGDGVSRPLAVQSAFGLGRVTFLGWDLDTPPFTDYKLRPEFWDWILRECGSALAPVAVEGKPVPGMAGAEEGLAAAMRKHVDTFADLPVISFGWVAFFIFLYLLVIGPLEYVLLKRVLGRLEWTWLTFPVIVLSVCAAAYFAAVALKGGEIRVNKVDVVEVDPASGRVYGQSWYTIFSPKLETYTVTVSPAAGWTSESENPGRETLTGWLAGGQGGRASLLRRGYEYDIAKDGSRYADGLIDVPVQVWSTKSFGSRWAAPLDPKAPVVESKLVHPPGDPTAVVGSLVNRMPLGEIQDVVVIYAGQAYTSTLGSLVPGVERQLVLREKPSNDWLIANAEAAERLMGTDTNRPGRSQAAILSDGSFPMQSVFFHESATRKDEGVTLQNATLRHLDQSWRLSPENRGEVIVIGRVAGTTGPAEDALGSRYSPTQLWLRGLPGRDQPVPLTGAGRQETFVRLYLPVR